jgi:hypothetical protein
MADKSVSPWAVVKRLLRSGRLLSVANRPHCRTPLNLTYEFSPVEEDTRACCVQLACLLRVACVQLACRYHRYVALLLLLRGSKKRRPARLGTCGLYRVH